MQNAVNLVEWGPVVGTRHRRLRPVCGVVAAPLIQDHLELLPAHEIVLAMIAALVPELETPSASA